MHSVAGGILTMGNSIQLKKAKTIKPGEHVLAPHSSGVLLAHKVTKAEPVDNGKWVELATDEAERGRVHVVGAEDVVAVVG